MKSENLFASFQYEIPPCIGNFKKPVEIAISSLHNVYFIVLAKLVCLSVHILVGNKIYTTDLLDGHHKLPIGCTD